MVLRMGSSSLSNCFRDLMDSGYRAHRVGCKGQKLAQFYSLQQLRLHMNEQIFNHNSVNKKEATRADQGTVNIPTTAE
uniref:Uncharacterized protein n=1 Tax=Parascaris univalens TaxID=6257 RepID=A0A915A2M6_PARUN